MAKRIDINRVDFYQRSKPELRERTENRLIQISELGMEEVGVAQFGIYGIASRIYIEDIWVYNEEIWKVYLEHTSNLLKGKSPSL